MRNSHSSRIYLDDQPSKSLDAPLEVYLVTSNKTNVHINHCATRTQKYWFFFIHILICQSKYDGNLSQSIEISSDMTYLNSWRFGMIWSWPVSETTGCLRDLGICTEIFAATSHYVKTITVGNDWRYTESNQCLIFWQLGWNDFF